MPGLMPSMVHKVMCMSCTQTLGFISQPICRSQAIVRVVIRVLVTREWVSPLKAAAQRRIAERSTYDRYGTPCHAMCKPIVVHDLLMILRKCLQGANESAILMLMYPNIKSAALVTHTSKAVLRHKRCCKMVPASTRRQTPLDETGFTHSIVCLSVGGGSRMLVNGVMPRQGPNTS